MRYPSWMMGQMEPDLVDRKPLCETAIPIEHCRSCKAPIWWGISPKGQFCPFDVDGTTPTANSHFKTCPDAQRWSKKGAK